MQLVKKEPHHPTINPPPPPFFRCEFVDEEECDIVMENVCKMEKSVSCRTVEKAAWKVVISQIFSFSLSNRRKLMAKISAELIRAITGLTRVGS